MKPATSHPCNGAFAMRPVLLAICLFVLSGAAIADETFRFPGGVVTVGD